MPAATSRPATRRRRAPASAPAEILPGQRIRVDTHASRLSGEPALGRVLAVSEPIPSTGRAHMRWVTFEPLSPLETFYVNGTALPVLSFMVADSQCTVIP